MLITRQISSDWLPHLFDQPAIPKTGRGREPEKMLESVREIIKTTSNRYGKCMDTNNCDKCTDSCSCIHNRTDTRYYRDSSNWNNGMGYRFSLGGYNRKMDRTPGPPHCQDNHRGCIHYQKPNWVEARPVLYHDPIVLSKLMLPAT
jgi:hypothetical protein